MKKRLPVFIVTLLVIEFLDELVFGVRETAWPLIRNDLNLSYTQIGLALSLPAIFGNVIETFLGILGDTWRRRVLILGGGVVFALAVLWVGLSQNYVVLLLAMCVLSPASGAFVSLSQASLMDSEPQRHEQNMARWTFAGSVGVVAGPLFLAAFITLRLGWRGLFIGLAIFSAVLVALAWSRIPRIVMPATQEGDAGVVSFCEGARRAFQALRRGEVLRWLVLLEFSDLMLDVLYGYLALYLVDVNGLSPEQASLGVAVWTGVGLLGDFLIIPLLERVRGLDYLRVSVLMELILFPAFLLVPNMLVKLVILGLLGFFNSGWYSVLQGKLYSAMPGQSGTVMTLGNLVGWVGKLIPLGIGLAAQKFGLGTAMWLLILGPIVLMLGLPKVVDAQRLPGS
jgi:MFS transporter, FSR family, fosmidomycin resistance protein